MTVDMKRVNLDRKFDAEKAEMKLSRSSPACVTHLPPKTSFSVIKSLYNLIQVVLSGVHEWPVLDEQ